MKQAARRQPLQRNESPSPSGTMPRPCLMLVTEPMEPTRLIAIVRVAVAGGVDIVQIRNREAHLNDLKETVAALRRLLPQTLLVINTGTSAPAVGFGVGIHLPEHGGSLRQARETRDKQALIGRSVHSANAAQQAEEEGADYVAAGTVFASTSHPDVAPAGLGFLEEVCRAVSLPVLAIGGVTPERAGDCLRVGAAGVAVLSPIMHAADPYSTAQQFRLALDTTWASLQTHSRRRT